MALRQSRSSTLMLQLLLMGKQKSSKKRLSRGRLGNQLGSTGISLCQGCKFSKFPLLKTEEYLVIFLEEGKLIVACCSTSARIQRGRQRLESRKRGMKDQQDMRLFIFWSEEVQSHNKELKGLHVHNMVMGWASGFLIGIDKGIWLCDNR
jgi:hypothetical protein